MTRRSSLSIASVYGLTLCAALGCGDAEPWLAISGRVTLDGQPIESGVISLVGEDDRYASADISAGRFEIPSRTGLLPGSYLVQVYGFEGTGRMIPDPDRPGERIEDTRQVIPARYNDNSKLSVDVTADNAAEMLLELRTR